MASTGSSSSAAAAEGLAPARADVVIGLTSHNDAQTIGAVVRAVGDGLAPLFADGAACLVLADAGSTDGTRQVVRESAPASALVELDVERGATFGSLPYHGRPHRAAALRAILEAAHRLEARACAVVDAGSVAAAPESFARLVAPVLSEGLDYVSPYYARHVNEGALTKAIVYPMFRALYGVRLRQPAASEFGCSARLAAHYLAQTFWDLEEAPAGIDVWLAVAAAAGQFRLGEAAFGPHQTSPGPPTDLSTTLAQVVAALFADIEPRADLWQRVRGSVAIPRFGTAAPAPGEPPALDIDALCDAFRLGYRELREIWTWVLPPRTIVELRRLTETASNRLRFEDRMWAGIVYDFAVGYSFHALPQQHLLRSLTPLYSGWLASFVQEASGASADDVEARIEQLCLAFEAEKRHLIARWRWPERLR